MISLSYAPLGDSALLVKLGDVIDRALNDEVHAAAHALGSARLSGVTDVVSAYGSLAVHYDAERRSYAEVLADVRAIMERAPTGARQKTASRVVGIPTRYDGPDLEAVASATGLTVEEVIALHTGREYVVYMLGFAPGFAYLGELHEKLRLPRRAEPRTRVPAGSVAIAAAQTAVYPRETAGGWHLIGRTDLVMFDPALKRPSMLAPGDRVTFVRVTR